MNIPCATKTTCPCDSLPDTAYSSEAVDTAEFISTQFARAVPPLGDSKWTRLDCQMTAANPNSQQAADQAAEQLAIQCAEGLVSPYTPDATPGGAGGGNGSTFVNAEQSCTVNCPDGSQFSYTVPPGQFTGSTQAAADAAAIAEACKQANARVICLSNITTSPMLNTPYSVSITASGGETALNENTWAMVSGSLPPGLTFNGGTGQSVSITGTATAPGTYPFQLQIVDAQGTTVTKQYSMAVGCVTQASITTNTGSALNNPNNVPMVSVTPDSPYTTAYKTQTSQFFSWDFVVSFQSSSSDVWNYYVSFTGATKGGPSIALRINGVDQTPTSHTGNDYLWQGSFTTSGCTPVVVEFTGSSGGTTPTNSGTGKIEWQAPS